MPAKLAAGSDPVVRLHALAGLAHSTAPNATMRVVEDTLFGVVNRHKGVGNVDPPVDIHVLGIHDVVKESEVGGQQSSRLERFHSKRTRFDFGRLCHMGSPDDSWWLFDD